MPVWIPPKHVAAFAAAQKPVHVPPKAAFVRSGQQWVDTRSGPHWDATRVAQAASAHAKATATAEAHNRAAVAHQAAGAAHLKVSGGEDQAMNHHASAIEHARVALALGRGEKDEARW